MKNKKNIIVIIISVIISLIISFYILVYVSNYCNIKLTTTISIVIALLIILPILGVLLLIIPPKIAEEKEQLIEKLFILDISSKFNNNEHIRITKKNILFKYKNVIKYHYIFPRLFPFLPPGRGDVETYNIIGKTQLTINESNEILAKINNLNANTDGDIIVNYNGNKKFVNKNDIDKIFWKYFTPNKKYQL